MTNVRPLLRMAISEELARPDPRIEMIIPPSDTLIHDELLGRYLNGAIEAKVSQIITFDASGRRRRSICIIWRHSAESFRSAFCPGEIIILTIITKMMFLSDTRIRSRIFL